ncbi:uncharacterized protein LOC135928639 [Gordionus sp. m RMFG-2023]|uniref:uncharacterized protein LOC135928639 n=1 Tax=Gordionus sp. m RMFG-2023 TaxID=3053472 RepID=UPI0031FD234D
MDVVAREMLEGLPWELLYADDLVLMANSEEELRDNIRIHNNDNLENGGLDIVNGLTLEKKVDKFGYLGDMLNADCGVDSAVFARIGQAWEKFREMSSILTNKKVSLKLKGKVYGSCVRSCLVYGGKTWAMKATHEVKLERTEMRMIRWICWVSLREKN